MKNILEQNRTVKSLDNIDYRTIEINDDVIYRWNTLRLLEGLDDSLKKKCALSYERMACYLINERNDVEELLFTIVFPCIKRIVYVLKDDVMPELIVEEFIRISKWFSDGIKNEFKRIVGEKIDFESEMCSYVSDYIIVRMIRDGKYKIIKSD